MKTKHLAAILIACFVLAGCNWIPSALRIGGSPVEKLQQRQEKLDDARQDELKKAQELSHKTKDALDHAQPSPEVDLAKEYASETVALMDQALGAAMASDLERWQDQVNRLLSSDPTVKMKAELERSREKSEIAALSEKVAKAEARVAVAEAKAVKFAKDADSKADLARWLVFILVGGGGLYLLTQIVTLALKFVPQLAPVAGVLNRVVAPAVHVAWQNAEQRAARGIAALHGVAAAVKDIRAKYDEQTAEEIIGHLDKGLDADHKETVAAIVNGR